MGLGASADAGAPGPDYGRPMTPQPTVERTRLLRGTGLAERREQVAGTSTAILEAGSGSPLILLHGGIECGGVYWAPVVAHLAEQRRLVVPDLPGLGESAPARQLDTGTFANWLGALVSATCEEPPILVAHSLLGSLAVRFAAERGDSLRSLLVYAAPGVGPYRMPSGLVYAAIRFGLRPSRRNSERFDRWAFFDLEQARGRDTGWFEAWSRYTMSRARIPHVKRTMRQLISRGRKRVVDDVLDQIEVPTTLLWGRHDRFVPLAVAEHAGKRIGWPLRVIDRTGHVPHIERPESFLRILLETIDSQPNRSAA
jgi:2-hydroxymuconate-semialdehyde hydrolase